MSFTPYPRNYRNGSVVIDNAQIGNNSTTLNGNTDQYFDKSIELNRTYGGYRKYWMGMIGEGNKTSINGAPNYDNSFGICVQRDDGNVAQPTVLMELSKDGNLHIKGEIIAGNSKMRFGRHKCMRGGFKTISFPTPFVNMNPDTISIVATAIHNSVSDMVAFNIKNITSSGFDIIANVKDGRDGQTGGREYDGLFSYIAMGF